jgi:hypothetical protein
MTYETSKYTKQYAIPKDVNEFWQIGGRKDILHKLNEILGGASKSVNYLTSAWGLVRAYKAHSEVLEAAKKRGVVVRMLSPVSSENAAVAEEFSETVELRRIEKTPSESSVSVDTRELLVIESNPDDLKTDRGFDLAVWSTNKLIVQLHDDFFEHMWSKLLPSRDAIEKNRQLETSLS